MKAWQAPVQQNNNILEFCNIFFFFFLTTFSYTFLGFFLFISNWCYFRFILLNSFKFMHESFMHKLFVGAWADTDMHKGNMFMHQCKNWVPPQKKGSSTKTQNLSVKDNNRYLIITWFDKMKLFCGFSKRKIFCHFRGRKKKCFTQSFSLFVWEPAILFCFVFCRK